MSDDRRQRSVTVGRGCQLIVVIDAEADPEMSFSSLLKAERYARIDLGVRIVLPWEKIAARSNRVGGNLLERAHVGDGLIRINRQ